MIIGEFVFGAAFNSEEDIRGGAGPLGTDYTVNVDTRFTDTTLGPLVTTVDCSGADAAGGGSVGTAATTRAFAIAPASMGSVDTLVVARGTKPGIINLSSRLQVANGTMEGAGAPYAEAITDVRYTKSGGGTEEISFFMNATAYRVATAVPVTGGFTASANDDAQLIRICFEGVSDSAATQYFGLTGNKVYANVLSGSTTMDNPAWQLIATVSGESFTFTGGAMLGRFPYCGTSNGVYILDSDAQRFRAAMDELANDTTLTNCFGMQSISIFGGALFVPLKRGLRMYLPGGDNFSVGPERYPNNTSPVKGQYGHVGATDLWGYLPMYDVIGDNSYICAIRPRQPGDQHSQEVSYYPIIQLEGVESKIAFSTGLAGSQTRDTIWVGSDDDVAWFVEGNTDRFPDDTSYPYAASGTLYSTKVRRKPGELKIVQGFQFQSSGCTSTETIAFDLVYTDHTGASKTVRCGSPVTKNGLQTVYAPGVTTNPDGSVTGGVKAIDFYLKITMARGSTTTLSPRIKYSTVRVLGA